MSLYWTCLSTALPFALPITRIFLCEPNCTRAVRRASSFRGRHGYIEWTTAPCTIYKWVNGDSVDACILSFIPALELSTKMSLRGVYVIQNSTSPLVIDLNGGLSENATAIRGWQQQEWNNATTFAAANQLWLVEAVANKADTYTLRNVMSGTCMDLFGSNPASGTPIIGFQGTGNGNQQWIIRKDANGYYRIQNVTTQTFVDLYNGGTADGTKIVGWGGSWGENNRHQSWSFHRMSLSSNEIIDILRSKNLAKDFISCQVDEEYLILPHGLWNTIWEGTKLKNHKLRRRIFDHDCFAAVYKAAVANWGDENIRVDGIAILCGLAFAKDQNGAVHAYNFTLAEDKECALVFEPQTNTFQDNSVGHTPFLGFYF